MDDYATWRARYPQAAAALEAILVEAGGVGGGDPVTSEAAAQQRARFALAAQGAMAWRNNVGATPARCKSCGAKQQPVRYGLCNDSQRLNERFKSSDLILAIPRVIRPEHVGTTIAQFGSVEMKPPGWTFSGNGRESAQAAWLALITKLGGFACFSTGSVKL